MSGEVAMETPVNPSEPKQPQPKMRDWNGLRLVIEAAKGENRMYGDGSMSMYMYADYGFVQGTVSMEEGDGLDVFLNPESDGPTGKVYTIALLNEDGTLNEEKVFLNFHSSKDAQKTFLSHYSEGQMGYIYVMSDNDFVKLAQARQLEAKLKDGNPAISDAEEGYEMMDEVMVVDQVPEVLSTTEEKSTTREPLYLLAKSLDSQQLRKVAELRRDMRRGKK